MSMYGLREAPRACEHERGTQLKELAFGLMGYMYELHRHLAELELWIVHTQKRYEREGIVATNVDGLLTCGGDGLATNVLGDVGRRWNLVFVQLIARNGSEKDTICVKFVGFKSQVQQEGHARLSTRICPEVRGLFQPHRLKRVHTD